MENLASRGCSCRLAFFHPDVSAPNYHNWNTLGSPNTFPGSEGQAGISANNMVTDQNHNQQQGLGQMS